MTEAATTAQQALADLDTAISGLIGEVQTLQEQLSVLQQQVSDPGTAVSPDLVAELQQRTARINAALAAASTAASSTAAGTPTSPDTTVGTGQDTDVSTAPSTPVDDSGQVGGVAASGGPELPDSPMGQDAQADPADTDPQPAGGSPLG